jgi:predicted nucleotidyltransferase
MHGPLGIDQDRLQRFCRERGIERLSLFGSHLKGTDRTISDVDLLVKFLAERTPTLLDMADMEAELSAMLNGRRVDLRTEQDLSRYFRDEVVAKAEVQFAAQ